MKTIRLKSLLALLLALSTLLLCCACGGAGDENDEKNPQEDTSSNADEESSTPEDVSVFAMTGPTGMGLAGLYVDSQAGETFDRYTFTMAATADEYLADLIAGNFDFACIPTNLAAVLSVKAPDTYQVAAVNTLGVLYILDATGAVQSVDDLKGKTIYATGEGLVPELCLRYVLSKNGLTVGEDVTVEFCATAADVGALLLSGEAEIAMLPQPYVTSVLTKNEDLSVALDLTKEWDKVAEGNSSLMTGCLVVNQEFASEHADAVTRFMEAYKASVDFINKADDAAADAVVQAGIVAAAPVAKAAIPQCNITFITGDTMQKGLSGFYQELFAIKPALLGGKLPDDSLYWIYVEN